VASILQKEAICNIFVHLSLQVVSACELGPVASNLLQNDSCLLCALWSWVHLKLCDICSAVGCFADAIPAFGVCACTCVCVCVFVCVCYMCVCVCVCV